RLVAKAIAERGKPPRTHRAIGVEVVGMTACPCAMETIRDELSAKDPPVRVPDGMPLITHNQRNRTTMMLDAPEDSNVEADELIDIVEASMSSPTYELLKRPEEARLVESAHRKPRFVEDVVREVVARVLKRYPALPLAALVTLKRARGTAVHTPGASYGRTTA